MGHIFINFLDLKETLYTCIFCPPLQRKIMKRSKICISQSPTEKWKYKENKIIHSYTIRALVVLAHVLGIKI